MGGLRTRMVEPTPARRHRYSFRRGNPPGLVYHVVRVDRKGRVRFVLAKATARPAHLVKAERRRRNRAARATRKAARR